MALFKVPGIYRYRCSECFEQETGYRHHLSPPKKVTAKWCVGRVRRTDCGSELYVPIDQDGRECGETPTLDYSAADRRCAQLNAQAATIARAADVLAGACDVADAFKQPGLLIDAAASVGPGSGSDEPG